MDYYKENYAEELRAFYLDEKYQNEILSIQREREPLLSFNAQMTAVKSE